ncbi:MAG: LysM peptidoglycan-binding domain-containing protein [Caldilineaceae bacterium]|nr:LysM peptidoglycan-binding domain-containing protein [Caldilineaceae bacterium]
MSRLHTLLPVVLCLLLVGACTRDRGEGIGLTVEADPVDPAALVGPEAEAAAAAAAYLTYVVKVGDALATVAAQHGTTVAVIRELNPQLTSDNLLPGDEIRIPAGLAPLEQPSQPLYYVVQQGDLVVSLAERFGVTLEQIREANPLVDLDQVPVGLRLVIPVPAGTEADPELVYEGLAYSVQPGDTLNAIALRYSVDPNELVLLNELVSADDLQIGQILRLPDHASVSSAVMQQPEPQGEGVVHVVQPGETLSGIALFYQVSTASLMAANGLSDADRLAVGVELLVPGVSPPEPTATPEPTSTPEPTEPTATPEPTADATPADEDASTESDSATPEDAATPTAEATPTAGAAQEGEQEQPVATEEPEPTATATPTLVTHTVQAGDTLFALALRYSTTVEAIQTANDLGSSVALSIGQELIIPVPE